MKESDKEYYDKRLSILHDSKIHLSAHTIDGWQGQYALMMRYYERALETDDKTDELDFWIAFFQNCFYIKDWIVNEKRNEDSSLRKKLNEFINNNYEMQVCRDLCNGTKHLVISNESIDKHIAIFHEYNPWHKLDDSEKISWNAFVNGERRSMSSLAKSCIKHWNNFIRTEGLI